jgi:hypothetical protein
VTHTIGWRERAASRTRSDSGDLDPGLLHRLEPLSLLLRFLVWDGADEVVAPAGLVDLARVPLDDDQTTGLLSRETTQARAALPAPGHERALARGMAWHGKGGGWLSVSAPGAQRGVTKFWARGPPRVSARGSNGTAPPFGLTSCCSNRTLQRRAKRASAPRAIGRSGADTVGRCAPIASLQADWRATWS